MSQLIREKILDIRIGHSDKGYDLYVPIKTGYLRIIIPNPDNELREFLETVLNTEVRRFGENPK